MISSSGSSRMRRFTLLIGMLLHLVGVAAIPFHVWAPTEPAGGSSHVAEREDGGSSLPAHDELHCVLCHAADALALPAPSAHLSVTDAAGRVEVPAPRHALPSRPVSPARARAPPLA